MKKRLQFKQNLKQVIKSAMLIVCLAVLAISCKENLIVPETPQPGDGLRLKISILTDAVVETRSPATQAELEIKNGYLFVFTEAGLYKDHGFIRTDNITSNGSTKPELDVTMTYKYEIIGTDNVVLILNQLPNGNQTIFLGMTRAELDKRFLLSTAKNDGFLPPLDDADTNLGMPMSGEAKGENYLSNFPITRALAKVQVKINAALDTGGAGAIHFTPENVTYRIYQNAIQGHVTVPYVTDPVTLNFSKDNTAYTVEANDADIINPVTLSNYSGEDNTTKGASYIYEFPYSTRIISTSADAENTAISGVEEAVYRNGRLAIILKVKQGNLGTYKYYKLALQKIPEGTTTNKYLDIKRNTHYTINIRSVNDKGYDTAKEALNTPPGNVEFDVIDNPSSHTTVSNGTYAISIGTQPYGGRTVDMGNKIKISDEVRYLLASNFGELPVGITNTIKVVADPPAAEGQITIFPTTMTARKQPLFVTFPVGYAGKIDYEIKFGKDLAYSSKAYGETIIVQNDNFNTLALPADGNIIMDYARLNDVGGQTGSTVAAFNATSVTDLPPFGGEEDWITDIKHLTHADGSKVVYITYQPHVTQTTQTITIDGKSYNLIYDNGYISPEMMAKTTFGKINHSTGIFTGDGYRNEWALYGFHLSKRGWVGHNSGIAVTAATRGIDPFSDITPATTYDGRPAMSYGTPYPTSHPFGNGAVQTAVRLAANEAAALYCTSLGGQWYIPGVSEVVWLRNVGAGTLGPSYKRPSPVYVSERGQEQIYYSKYGSSSKYRYYAYGSAVVLSGPVHWGGMYYYLYDYSRTTPAWYYPAGGWGCMCLRSL